MASKRHIRRKSCDGKKRYETKEKAAQVAYYYHLRHYACAFCGGFHVGHEPHAMKIAKYKKGRVQAKGGPRPI